MATPIGIPGNTAIIPVNTQTVSKTITLPSVQSNPGRVIIIKDNTGNSATNNIFISTTGADTLDKTFSVNTILSTSYGAWIFTNDGINTWFLIENYMNTLTLQNRNLLAPFPPFTVSLSVVENTFISIWTASINATSYSVSYYSNTIPQASGGTLLQTTQAGTTLTNTTVLTTTVTLYYYAVVTATNANNSTTTTSLVVLPNLFPSNPTNIGLASTTSSLICSWTPTTNTLSYTVIFYQNTSQSTAGSSLIQAVTGLTVPFYTLTTNIIQNLYYYTTVQAVNLSALSSAIQSPYVISTIYPSPVTLLTILVYGINTLCRWQPAINATSYSVAFYQNGTPTTSGGSLIETVVTTSAFQASSAVLTNGNYIYAIVTSINQYGVSTSATTPFSTSVITVPPVPPTTFMSGNATATWGAVTNATSYTVFFYQTSSPIPSGGVLFYSAGSTASTTLTCAATLVNGYYYYATVQANNIYGSYPPRESQNTTASIQNAPQPPSLVSISKVGTNLLATWTAGLNATSYTIVFYQNDTAITTGGSLFETTPGQLGTSQASTTFLINGKYYYATVQSFNPYGSSSATTSATTTTQIIGTIPSAPSNVVISISGVNTVVTWTASANASTYSVTIFQNNTPSTLSGTLIESYNGLVSTSQTSSTILLNGKYYYAKVNAKNLYGSSYDVTTANTTAAISNPPQPPTNVSLVQLGTYFLASWAAAINATSYNIIFYQNNTPTTTGGSVFETANGNTGTAQNSSALLLNGKYYYVTVMSVSSYNSLTSAIITSLFSSPAVTGINPSPTTSATIAISGVNTLVTWATAPNATSYIVIFYQNSSAILTGGTSIETFTPGQAATTQTSSYILRNGTYIYATVTSVNIYNNSVAVLTSSTTTVISNAPQPPTNVTITQSGTSVVASWTAAINATSYNIIFYQNNTATTTGGSTTQIFSYTNATQVWTAPTGVTSISVTMTGGGGGGGGSQPGPGALGGAGGYLSGTLTVTPGTTYTIYVAGGGVGAAGSLGSAAGGFGGGGSSAGSGGGGGNTAAGGGGTSYILNGSTLIVAVGGGGGGGYFSYMTGGNGGGQTGGNGGAPYNGTGGTQLAGGTVGSGGAGGIGSYLQGGNAPDYYGGGGGGYYGGGAGLGGGGGSDYSTSLTNITQTQGGGATGGSGALALSNNKGVNGGNGSITILISTKAPFETDNGQTGTSQSSSTLLLNTYYYYATVTSFSSYNSTTSPTITTSSTTSAITGINPSPTATALITLSGVNTLISWSAAPNATSYTILLYQTATQTVSGGSLVETMSGQVSTSQTTSYILRNGTYYYASVTSVNIYNNSSAVLTSATTAAVSNAPQPPTNITVTFSGSVLSSSWTAAINATSYNVSFYYGTTNTTSGGTFVETDNTSGTTQNLVLASLGGYYYYTTVTTVSSYNSTTSSTITSTNAAQITVAPSAPTNVAVSMSGYYAVCTWTPAINTTTYTVTFYSNSTATTTLGNSFDQTTLLANNTTTKTATTLTPNNTYVYAIVTGVNGYTSTSTTSASTTSLNQFSPTNPSNVTVAVSGINIVVSWTASSFYVTGYTVVLYNNGSTNSTTGGTAIETTPNLTGTSRTTTSTLTNANYYYATVTATNAIPLSSSTITSSSAVQAFLYLQNVTLSISSSTGVATLSWTAISGSPTYTYVLYQATGNNYTSGTINAYGTTSSSSLTINTYSAAYYYFTVVATISGSSTLLTTSSIVQSTYSTAPLVLWLDASATATITGTTSVTAWNDRSGLANNCTGVAGHLPALTANAQNGLSVMTFAGNQALTGNISFTTISYTQFAIYSNTTTNVGQAFMDSMPTRQFLIQNGGGNQFQTYFSYAGVFQTTGYRIVTVNVIDPGSYVTVWFNGTNQSFPAGGVANGSVTTYYIGSRNDNIYFYGNLAEVIFYTVSLTSTQQSQIEGYLAWKWGLQGNLPDGHLYKSASPGITPGTLTISGSGPNPITNAYLVTATNVATMTWSAYTGATGYTWVLIQSTNTNVYGPVLSTGTVSSSTLTASYTGLTLNNYYIFGVYATTASTPSLFGSSMFTLYNNGVPTGGSITLAPFTNLTGGSVTITGLAMNATGYIFYISTTTSIANAIYNSSGVVINTFNYTGSDQSLVIPSGTTSAGVTLKGAGGGSAGGLVSGTLTVTPNETLTIIVGRAGIAGNTGSALGTNYGGGGGTGNGYGDSGGGMASIKRGTTMIVVAGAAGGSGYGSATGGVGGGLTGGTGGTFNSPAVGGTGGTQSAGGTGINGGASGGLGIGGAGTSYGGGGGGGYYGGGGGGYIPSPSNADGGGGGGSSYVANLTGTVVNTQGGGSSAGANGQVVITFGSGSSAQYTLNQTIAFTATLSNNTAYYAILVPSNSFGNGTAVVSSSQTTPSALYSFTGTLTFTPAGATGRSGPTLSQCTTAYSSFGSWVTNTAYFNMTQAGYQLWTVPQTKTYTIVCAGAGTYYTNASGATYGRGQIISSSVSLTQGQILCIVVGQLSGGCSPFGTANASGGGGGTYVALGSSNTTATIIVAAGGGGGQYGNTTNFAQQNATTSTTGNTGQGGAAGGANGAGGSSTGAWSGGGGGFTGNGANTSNNVAGGGLAFRNGSTGGTTASCATIWGGFGGGGGTHGNSGGGGGGGGYSGGGSGPDATGNTGGGGGSFLPSGATSTGLNPGNGYVQIT